MHTEENGAAALDNLQKNIGHYDLLITDIVMPGLNGKELARQARELQPGLPVLLMTGYGFEIDLEELSEVERIILMPKPFTIEEISTAVRDLLEKP